MQMFEKILVPLDGSPLAQVVLPYVMLMAKGFDSRVILFHVAETALDHEAPEHKAYAHETMERIRPLAENYLAGVADQLREEDIEVETKVVKGKAVAQIVEEAEQEKVGLVAMSTHGRSGLARLVMGSQIDRILHACEQPVLLVRPREEDTSGEAVGRLSKIIVALDGSKDAEAAIPLAEELAKVLGLELILVQVVHVETTVYFGSIGPDSWGVPSDVLQRLAETASDYLKGLAKQLEARGLTVRSEVLLGWPGPRIVEFAKETPDSLIAMTTHGRSGFHRWATGSVTDAVVRQTGEPVLVVRPQAR
jgi:nucleotide-binding universal stress UspA family protein